MSDLAGRIFPEQGIALAQSHRYPWRRSKSTRQPRWRIHIAATVTTTVSAAHINHASDEAVCEALSLLQRNLSNQWIRRMSFVLQKHQRYVLDTVFAYQAKLDELESDIRLRAMSNDTRDAELALLRRLKEECTATLYRYQNLKEAFRAVVGDNDAATEEWSQDVCAARRSGP